MKQTLGIVRYNFFGFFRNPKVIFTLFLEFVLSFLLTRRIMVVMDNYNTPVQAIEPFLWTFGDGTAVLLSSMLLLLLAVLRPAENDTSHSLSADPYHQEEMALRPVCLYYIRNDFIYMFYAFVYFCAVHEGQLSRQSVE